MWCESWLKKVKAPWEEVFSVFCPHPPCREIIEHIRLTDLISSASDRAAVGSFTSFVNYDRQGWEITHLLSGETQRVKLDEKPTSGSSQLAQSLPGSERTSDSRADSASDFRRIRR